MTSMTLVFVDISFLSSFLLWECRFSWSIKDMVAVWWGVFFFFFWWGSNKGNLICKLIWCILIWRRKKREILMLVRKVITIFPGIQNIHIKIKNWDDDVNLIFSCSLFLSYEQIEKITYHPSSIHTKKSKRRHSQDPVPSNLKAFSNLNEKRSKKIAKKKRRNLSPQIFGDLQGGAIYTISLS